MEKRQFFLFRIKLCNKIVWLEKGVVKAFGDAKEIAEEYRNS